MKKKSKNKSTIKKISKYATTSASALLAAGSANAAVITNDIPDLLYEPTTIGESFSMDIDGNGVNDISLFAYDPSFDEVYIILTGFGIAVEPDGLSSLFATADDVDFDCITDLSSSAGSINRLGPGVSGFIPVIFNIGEDEHFGAVEITTVAGTGSQADDVRKVIVHSFVYNDVPNVDGGCTIATVSLAVGMSSFNAYGLDDKVVLEWTTDLEEGNKGFDIQRSFDGKEWISLGFVEGQGNSYTKKTYSWIDNSPLAPQAYYRLEQIDFNGIKSVSSILTVKILKTESNLELSAYPNPTTNYLSYHVRGERVADHEVSVWNLEGKLMLKKQVISEGLKTLNVSTLENGSFILNVKVGNNNYSKLFMKN